MMKKGFTLLEVNLAIFVVATGVLSMLGLYSLGYRENRQSVEDVNAASYADAFLAPLVQGLSATNMEWQSWIQIGDEPSQNQTKTQGVADALWPQNGWLQYVQRIGSTDNYRINGDPSSVARSIAGQVLGKVPSEYRGSVPTLPGDGYYGLVVTRRGSVIQLALRVSRRREALMNQQPVVCEVRFQGVVK